MGWGQGLGEQLVAAPCQLPPQLAWVVALQAPLASQQAPVGWGHGLGEQVVPLPS